MFTLVVGLSLLTFPPSLPKLQHGLDRVSYLKDNGGVVQTDPQALIRPWSAHAPPSTDLKSLETRNKTSKIVRRPPFLGSHHPHEENLPKFLLDADQQSFLACPASMRASFHSYSDFGILLFPNTAT